MFGVGVLSQYLRPNEGSGSDLDSHNPTRQASMSDVPESACKAPQLADELSSPFNNAILGYP
jgi:hypothetical protein